MKCCFKIAEVFNKKQNSLPLRLQKQAKFFIIWCLSGIEPPHAAPEAAALSTELQAHYNICIIPQLNVLYNLGAHALAFILQKPFFMLQLAY